MYYLDGVLFYFERDSAKFDNIPCSQDDTTVFKVLLRVLWVLNIFGLQKR